MLKTAHLGLALLALTALGCDSCGGKKPPAESPTTAGSGSTVGPVIVTADGGRVQVQAAITEDLANKVAGPVPKDGKLKGAATPLAVQCKAGGQPVSPGIYGVAWAELDKDFGATEHRWGGNTTSRYNPKLGKAWSSANDWFWENTEPDWTWEQFVDKAAARGGRAAITIPMLGWVAKDTESCAFTSKEYPKQEKFDPHRKQCGNGKKPDGKTNLDPPKDPSKWQVKWTPQDAADWITKIKAADAKRGKKVVFEYILDNEPALWDSSHRDIHPEGSTYDELLEKTIAYATAIRKADPDAVIAGPAEWGWPGYFFSGKDAKAGFQLKPDRRAHGDTPFLEWYLKKLAEYEKRNGIKLLDVLDVHIYPQADGVQNGDDEGGDGGGQTDRNTNELRLRTTRSLWDREYKDESWIKEAVYLIPRMKDLIAANYPGLGFQIGEYNFGAEKHINGAVAQAEAFGRFALFGVSHAFYWTFPKAKSPVYWAFRAYRNYDGAGGHFQDTIVPSSSPSGTSLFASRDESGKKWVLVALNFSADRPFDGAINLDGCGAPTAIKAFTYTGGDAGLVAGTATAAGSGLSVKMPPMSINVYEVTTP
ncbi:MAG: glycoside hydrolase family 44 protein [Labilithrix sp.]